MASAKLKFLVFGDGPHIDEICQHVDKYENTWITRDESEMRAANIVIFNGLIRAKSFCQNLLEIERLIEHLSDGQRLIIIGDLVPGTTDQLRNKYKKDVSYYCIKQGWSLSHMLELSDKRNREFEVKHAMLRLQEILDLITKRIFNPQEKCLDDQDVYFIEKLIGFFGDRPEHFLLKDIYCLNRAYTELDKNQTEDE